VKAALIVVDMQNDFVRENGALYVPHAEKTIPVIQKLIEESNLKKIPVIFTLDWHSENDPEFEKWPVHCVANSIGAKIISELDLNRAEIVKQNQHDKFHGTRLEEFLREKEVDSLFFCGVATEYCVKFTARTAIEKGFKVFIVTDAIKPVNEVDGTKILVELTAKGAELIEFAGFVSLSNE